MLERMWRKGNTLAMLVRIYSHNGKKYVRSLENYLSGTQKSHYQAYTLLLLLLLLLLSCFSHVQLCATP